MKIAINGVGVVGGFGCGITALDTALGNQKTDITEAAFETSHEKAWIPAYLADTAPLETFVPKKSLRRIDHFSRMALLGAFLALKDAGTPDISQERIGVVIASGYGVTRTTFSFLDTVMQNGEKFPSPTLFSNSVHNAAAGHISILLKLHGPTLTVSQFEMSVPAAFHSAGLWLADDRVDSVLLGAVDEYCEVLGYCRHHCIKRPARNVGKAMPEWDRSVPPGEGSAFFLLSREKSGPSSYGFIRDIQMGRMGAEGFSPPKDTPLIIGMDGLECENQDYEACIGTHVEAASYASLYGSLPIGPAFDTAIACLSLKKGFLYAAPGASGYPGKMNILKENKKLTSKSLCSLKLGQEKTYGLVTLTKEGDPDAVQFTSSIPAARGPHNVSKRHDSCDR